MENPRKKIIAESKKKLEKMKANQQELNQYFKALEAYDNEIQHRKKYKKNKNILLNRYSFDQLQKEKDKLMSEYNQKYNDEDEIDFALDELDAFFGSQTSSSSDEQRRNWIEQPNQKKKYEIIILPTFKKFIHGLKSDPTKKRRNKKQMKEMIYLYMNLFIMEKIVTVSLLRLLYQKKYINQEQFIEYKENVKIMRKFPNKTSDEKERKRRIRIESWKAARLQDKENKSFQARLILLHEAPQIYVEKLNYKEKEYLKKNTNQLKTKLKKILEKKKLI